jgi:hypothetical protein
VRRTLTAAAGSLLVFHFLILTASLYSASFSFLDPLLSAPLPASAWTAYELLTRLGRVYPVWALGAAVLVGPVFAALRRPPPPPGLGRRLRRGAARWLLFWPGVVLVPGAAVAVLWAMQERRWSWSSGAGEDPRFNPALAGAVLVAGLAVLWFFLRWLLRAVTGRPVPRRAAFRASAWMLLFPLLPPLVDVVVGFARQGLHRATGAYPPLLPVPAAPLVWAAIIAAVGVALLFQLSLLAVRLVRWTRAFRALRSGWSQQLLLSIYFVVCLPLGWALGTGGRRPVEIWDLHQLAFQVDRFVPYLALLGLALLVVRSNPDDGFDLPPAARLAGILIFAFYLAGRTVNLWFVPIPLLLGWVLFDRWVLRRHSAPVADRDRARLIERILGYRRAARRAEQLPKALDKVLGEAKITLQEAAARIARAEHAARDAKAALPGSLAAARQAVFGSGGGAGPWANARVSLAYGTALAIPFVTLGLLESRDAPIGNFPFLQLAGTALFATSTWLTLAFLFGYFFHLIRGRDGLTKALTLSLALVAATVPFRVLRSQPLFGTDHLVEMVRLALFVLLLALLAFDLRSLRALGFRNRDFLAVHGLSTAAGYLGSILVTAAATYLGSDLLPRLAALIPGLGSG